VLIAVTRNILEVPREGYGDSFPRPTRVRHYDKRLGNQFIELALFFNVNWTDYASMSTKAPIHWPDDLVQAHERAIDETTQWYTEYGDIDGKAVKTPMGYRYYLRKPRIGDEVTVVASNTESDQLYQESEARPTILPPNQVDYPQTREHASGDARWFALNDTDYDVIHEKGRWVHRDGDWQWQTKEDYFEEKSLIAISTAR